MKSLKVFALLCVLLAAAVGISACGGSKSDEGTTTGSSQRSGGGNGSAKDVSTAAGFLATDNVSEAFDQFKQKAGGKAELHSVEIKPDEIAFEYTEDNQQADGFIWTSESLKLEPIEVDEFGTGEIPSYPVGDFDPAAPGKINKQLEEMGYDLANITLDNTESSEAQWKITANKGNTYNVEFVADANGGSLKKTASGAQAPQQPSADEAQKQAECLQKAGGDVKKVQECTK